MRIRKRGGNNKSKRHLSIWSPTLGLPLPAWLAYALSARDKVGRRRCHLGLRFRHEPPPWRAGPALREDKAGVCLRGPVRNGMFCTRMLLNSVLDGKVPVQYGKFRQTGAGIQDHEDGDPGLCQHELDAHVAIRTTLWSLPVILSGAARKSLGQCKARSPQQVTETSGPLPSHLTTCQRREDPGGTAHENGCCPICHPLWDDQADAIDRETER